MSATTSYGTWNNHGDSGNLTVEDTIATATSGADLEWCERFPAADAAATYRAEINAALPEGVSLCGNEFYGPYFDAPDVDIAEIVDSVDLMAIIERLDPDTASNVEV